MAQHTGGAMATLRHLGMDVRFLNAVKSLFFYLYKMAVPIQLVPFYPLPIHFNPLDSVYIFSLVLLFLMTGFCLWMWGKKRHSWLILWSAYVITLLPVLGIIQVGSQAAADRYTYLPSIGPFILFGAGAEWLWNHLQPYKKLFRGFAAVSLVVVMVLLTYLTEKQVRLWKNGETLLNYVINIFPDSAFLAYNNLGAIYTEKGMMDEAILLYKKALEITPNDPIILTNLGKNYGHQGRLNEAKAMLQKAMNINPDYAAAHIHLGDVFIIQKSIDQAILEYGKGAEADSGSAEAHYKLGMAYYMQGMLNEAITEFKDAVNLNRSYTDAYYNLGIVMSRKGMLDQAMDAFGNAIRLEPKNPQIHNNLGIIYAQKGMFQEALGSFEKALSLDPYNADVHYNISRLFYMQKDFKSAYQYAVKAKGFGYPVPEDYLKTLR